MTDVEPLKSSEALIPCETAAPVSAPAPAVPAPFIEKPSVPQTTSASESPVATPTSSEIGNKMERVPCPLFCGKTFQIDARPSWLPKHLAEERGPDGKITVKCPVKQQQVDARLKEAKMKQPTIPPTSTTSAPEPVPTPIHNPQNHIVAQSLRLSNNFPPRSDSMANPIIHDRYPQPVLSTLQYSPTSPLANESMHINNLDQSSTKLMPSLMSYDKDMNFGSNHISTQLISSQHISSLQIMPTADGLMDNTFSPAMEQDADFWQNSTGHAADVSHPLP
jgi:hypothetical protein